jgi:hypothetical protein
MELFLPDYDPVLAYFNSTSFAVDNEDYNSILPLANGPSLRNEGMIEYSRLFQEIEFLVRHWDPVVIPNPIVVVQGSYPNSHYSILSSLFSSVTFHLWDSNNVLTNKKVESERVQVNNEDLAIMTAREVYGDKGVLFICYLQFPSGDMGRADKYTDFWNTGHSFQAEMLRMINPAASNLTFCLPLSSEEDILYTYYRGYITPSYLTEPISTDDDRICRLVSLKQNELLVHCNYSAKWYDQVLNYWNLAAKKGSLLRNPITRTSYKMTGMNVLYFGLEICRVTDAIHQYLLFSEAVEEITTDNVIFDTVLGVLAQIDDAFEDFSVSYSLEDHSSRYKSGDISPGMESIPPVFARPKATYPETIRRAQALLLSQEETITDLTL